MESNKVVFGAEARKHFRLDPDGIHLNNGSYGSVPNVVFDARVRDLEKLEFHPDSYMRRYISNAWEDSLKAVCNFLGWQADNTVFVESTTRGINDVLKSLPLEKGDAILVNTWTHKGILNTCKSATTKLGAEILQVELKVPVVNRQQVITAYRKYIGQHSNIKVAVIDYITVGTATMFPVKELVQVCRDHDIITVVDAAHAPGQVHIDLNEIKPDFLAGNLHKWVYTPRGCAVLYVNPKYHPIIEPVMTSHSYGAARIQDNFKIQATRDYSPYVVAKDAVEFYSSIGGLDAVRHYVMNMLDEAVKLLVDLWQTDTFPIPKDMEAPYLRLVRLPEVPACPPSDLAGANYGDYKSLLEEVFYKYKIQCLPLHLQEINYVRLSGTIHNTLDDYRALGKAVLAIKEKGIQES